MEIKINYHSEFRRQLKTLAKKYKSIKTDFQSFLESLNKNPFQGIDMGDGVRKMRMAIASKGKGKSGGARVITFSININEGNAIEITLLTIYDKSEIENVSDNYIRSLIKTI